MQHWLWERIPMEMIFCLWQYQQVLCLELILVLIAGLHVSGFEFLVFNAALALRRDSSVKKVDTDSLCTPEELTAMGESLGKGFLSNYSSTGGGSAITDMVFGGFLLKFMCNCSIVRESFFLWKADTDLINWGPDSNGRVSNIFPGEREGAGVSASRLRFMYFGVQCSMALSLDSQTEYLTMGEPVWNIFPGERKGVAATLLRFMCFGFEGGGCCKSIGIHVSMCSMLCWPWEGNPVESRHWSPVHKLRTLQQWESLSWEGVIVKQQFYWGRGGLHYWNYRKAGFVLKFKYLGVQCNAALVLSWDSHTENFTMAESQIEKGGRCNPIEVHVSMCSMQHGLELGFTNWGPDNGRACLEHFSWGEEEGGGRLLQIYWGSCIQVFNALLETGFLWQACAQYSFPGGGLLQRIEVQDFRCSMLSWPWAAILGK